MIRRWVLTGVAMMIILGGCANDERKARVQFTLGLMDQTTSLVRNIKEKLTAATQQMETDKELNLDETIKKCEELKDFCKKSVQKQAEDIRTARLGVTDAEKEEYKTEFEPQIRSKMKSLLDETLELDKALKKLEDAVKTQEFKGDEVEARAKKSAVSALAKLKKKFDEAQAEFETLNRKSQ